MGAISLVASAILILPAHAQQPVPTPLGQPAPVAPPSRQPAQSPAQAQPKAPPAKSQPAQGQAAKPAGGDQALRQRIEALEEQLVDMQVVVGTLESLARSGAAASASSTGGAAAGGGSGIDTARLSGLETQVRNLTQQVQQLSDQVRGLGGTPVAPRRDSGARDGGARDSGALPSTGAGGFAATTVTPAGGAAAAPSLPGWSVSPTGAPPAAPGGRNTDIASDTLPPIPAAVGAAPAPPAGGASSVAGETPRQAYDSAYQLLLQQDYGAAETAFDDFLKRYPNDQLAGSAQFWLGESHFVRGQYKAAASAFLKGYQTYGRSSKAPDSLLKLAMSLGRLGQKDAACSSLAELGQRYPQATADVKSRAVAERQRTGCP